MNGDERDEIKTTVERTGRRISETGEVRRFTQTLEVDEEGTVRRTTEIEKGMNDCGHYAEAGAVCQACGSFTICEACARAGLFICGLCGVTCCPRCGVESLFHPGKRFCQRCGFRGLLREALKGKR
jgi:hypothetical protein